MRSSGETLVAFLAGLAMGASIALLTAPQSGVRTRRDIRRRAEDAQSYLEELGDDLIERGRELIEHGRESAGETVRDIGKKVKESV